MNIINSDFSGVNYEDKRKIFDLYYYIIEQIKGKKINIYKKEYEEIISSTDFSTIIHYIKEAIPILINKKLDEFQNLNKQNLKDNIFSNQSLNYDNQLKNLESQLRFYISKQLQYKIQRDTYETKLRNFMDMEIEYDNLKQKLKYDGKNFLDNDRKENEIEILRRENSNLKKAISQLETEKKYTDSKRIISQKTIITLKNQIEQLNNKLYKVEKELKALKNNQTSNINININNEKSSSNYVINQNYNPPKRNKINLKKQNNTMSFKELKPPKNNNNNNNHINNRYENKQKPNNLLDNQLFTNTYNRILNCLSSNKKSNHNRNNSMNNVEGLKKTDIISKYFSHRGPKSNYFNYNNCFKFSQYSSAIPSSRNSMTKDKNKTSTLSTMYNNNTKISRSGNRSTINIRSNSYENY